MSVNEALSGRPTVLVTGGAGYIGSHTCVSLAEAGYRPVILDNFSNSSPVAVERVRELVSIGCASDALEGGRAEFDGVRVPCIEGDIRDRELVVRILRTFEVGAVIHFAASKAVGESVERPLEYFDNNISGTIALLQSMSEVGVGALVFSSSCTVYGAPATVPVDEFAPRSAANPYGRTKLVMEDMIGDLCASDPRFKAILLRYFNPVGAHPSGRLGEDPRGIPGNLLPFVAQVAVGRREQLLVFGTDWPTADGTGVRDYIHVMDLAEAHVAALRHVETEMAGGDVLPLNLGTGQGHSVLEVVRAFERASGRQVPYALVGRRPGDIAQVWADPRMARNMLGWSASRDLHAMCTDAWRWQSMNPDGYDRWHGVDHGKSNRAGNGASDV
jgi:UDP-glucose 4-epimerase